LIFTFPKDLPTFNNLSTFKNVFVRSDNSLPNSNLYSIYSHIFHLEPKNIATKTYFNVAFNKTRLLNVIDISKLISYTEQVMITYNNLTM